MTLQYAQKRLYTATDHGRPVTIPSEPFAPSQRGGGWGPFAESFVRFNGSALEKLDIQPQFSAGPNGPRLHFLPGSKAGAIPLRSAYSGHVTGGFIVRPRFGWPGVGQVLAETGWQGMPEFLELPLVPGSGREVPAWVLAGPILSRLDAMLRTMKRGYRDVEKTLLHPRGRIVWDRYRNESLVQGKWAELPCRFPDLGQDLLLRRHVRWAVEKVNRDLQEFGRADPVASALAQLARRMIEALADASPLFPHGPALNRQLSSSRLLSTAHRGGLEALSWVVEERGLGGGREQDGLAWSLPLERLWEGYVEAVIRGEAANDGGQVKVGRLGETVFPVEWSDPGHRSLGHLVPDIVVLRGHSVQIVDAKYKAHLAELDETGWHQFAEDTRESHRADVHQILAYASLYEAEDITATLAYPLRKSTWEYLRKRRRDISRADLLHGGRCIHLQLRGLPFGHTSFDRRGPN